MVKEHLMVTVYHTDMAVLLVIENSQERSSKEKRWQAD